MKLTAIILAGGKSSRMGEDKGLIFFEEKLMIQYVIDVAKLLVDEIIIIANNKKYEQFGYSVYEDLIKNKGPIAGIYTGLYHTKTAKNIVLSCDVPFVSEEVLELLINNCQNYDVIIPKKNKRTHPMIGIYDKSCSEVLKNELDTGQLKLKLAIKKMNCKVVDANFINDKIFNNINSKNDIEA